MGAGFLILVHEIELEIVDVYGIALLDSRLTELIKDTVFGEDTLEEIKRFVVGEVDLTHKVVEPFTLDIILTVFASDIGFTDTRGVGNSLILGGDFGFVDGEGRKVGKCVCSNTDKLLKVLAGVCGNIYHLSAKLLGASLKAGDNLVLSVDGVNLVCYHYLRTGSKLGRIFRKLGINLIDIVKGVSAIGSCDVNNMKKQSASVDMAKECVAESKSVGCTLDKSGDVGGEEAPALSNPNNAKVRGESGEVIVCDFRLCRRDFGEDGGFADIGEADKSDLRKHFEACVEKFGGMVVQEYIPQTGTQYKCEVFIDGNGEVKSAHVFDKTRWYPIDGGSTCCSTSVDRPDIVKSCIELLKALNWKGYGDVDLIEDPRDGIAKVMEINPRITASVKVCIKSGVDFARQIVEYETGREVTDYNEYEKGVCLRYMHTDLLWFIESPNRFKSKPSWFSWKRTCDQIWSIKDPLPWFTYTLQGFAKFGKEKKKRKR